MRAVSFLVAAVIPADVLPQALPENVRAAIENYLQGTSSSQMEIASLGIPVKAETCRIFDRGKGLWVSAVSTGIAVHVRFRTRDRFGATVMHSKVVFLDDKGRALDAYDTGTVRCSDPRLMK